MKVQAINRKQFLQGQFKGELPIRPPWSIEETQFADTCSRCFKCAEACPSNLIVKGSNALAGGFPELSFLRQGCDFCEACVRACPEPAMSLTHLTHGKPWNQLAQIDNQCFAERGIVCRSCGEVCEASAIDFKLMVGGLSQVNINTAACNGCGECVHVCPAHAIKIRREINHE